MTTVLVETYLGRNYNWPGTSDNPMRPILYRNPFTNKEEQAHYNDRNLQTNQDYKDAGFEWVEGKGWCYPVSSD